MARYIVAIVLLAVSAGPVYAQKKPPDNPLAVEEQQKKKEAEAVEKQYDAMRKNSDQAATPTRTDPWQNMRGADDSKIKR
jgi:hypothetical protein